MASRRLPVLLDEESGPVQLRSLRNISMSHSSYSTGIKRVCRYDESTRPCKAISMHREIGNHIWEFVSSSVRHREQQRKNFRTLEKYVITMNLSQIPFSLLRIYFTTDLRNAEC